MYKTIRQSMDLSLGGGELSWPDVLAVQGEQAGHRWVVTVLDGGSPADLSGATADCYVVNGGVTNRVEAAIQGHTVSAVFSSGCYAQSGELRAVLRVCAGESAASAVALLRLRVQEGPTDQWRDPGQVIPSLKELLAQLDVCREAATLAEQAAGLAGSAADEADEAASAAAFAATSAHQAASAAASAATAANTAAQTVEALNPAALAASCEEAAQNASNASNAAASAASAAGNAAQSASASAAACDTAAAGADQAAQRALSAIEGVENLDVEGIEQACAAAASAASGAAASAGAAAETASAAAENARTAASAANAAAGSVDASIQSAASAASAASEAAALAGQNASAAGSAAAAANAAAIAADTAAEAALQVVQGVDVDSLYAGYAPRNPLYDGADLSQVFGSAQALHEAVSAGDFTKIRVGDYWPITLSGAFRDYAGAANQTFDSVNLVMEVAGINVYLNYGDQALAQNHLLLCSRDLLPADMKLRSAVDTWYSASESNPWRGSHLFQTLNNATNGVLKLLLETPLGPYVYEGPSGGGMRMLAETKASGVSSASGTEWIDRGRLFLPAEREVWGQVVYASPTGSGGLTLQWPLFQGSRRHIGKARGAVRGSWWCQDSVEGSPRNFVCVRQYGHSSSFQATNPFSVPLCFLIV